MGLESPVVNDGWHDQNYIFGDDDVLNKRLSALINEFCHVFRAHSDGNWKTIYKPRYTELMALELLNKPSLIRKLLALKDPVVSNITFAAIDLNKTKASASENP
tara:strand:- start:6631 stop:6942 length:312 start_codon:yes stop_codon:yes gene_type:complete